MTRVLVVDDSQYTRTVVGNALAAAGYDVETAANGEAALEATDASDPDVVAMDAELPDVDGLEALDRIMATNPTLVLILAVEAGRGAAALEALERGAVDVFRKSTAADERTAADLADEIVEAVDELTTPGAASHALARAATTATAAQVGRSGRERTKRRPAGDDEGDDASAAPTPSSTLSAGVESGGVEIAVGTTDGRAEPSASTDHGSEYVDDPTVIVGASTGGPKVVERVFEQLPAALGAKAVIVQHMPAAFTGRFARRLDGLSAYDVREASDRDAVGPGEAVVAPGDAHLEVTANVGDRIRVRLDRGERIHSVRPAIDVTMQTAAERVSDPLCGVVCSGMGRDGAAGIEAIDAAGGHTIAQDEATSPVFGIPSAAIRTGAVDQVVPGTAVAGAIADAFVTDGETDE